VVAVAAATVRIGVKCAVNIHVVVGLMVRKRNTHFAIGVDASKFLDLVESVTNSLLLLELMVPLTAVFTAPVLLVSLVKEFLVRIVETTSNWVKASRGICKI